MMVICHIKFDSKFDQILQNSSQKPSMPFKYDCVLDASKSMLGSWKFEYNSGMKNYVDLWCQIGYQKWSSPTKLQSGTIYVLQVCLCSWCTYNHARELKIWIQLRNDKLCWFMMSNFVPEIIQSSKFPVRNHQCPSSLTVFLMPI